MHTEEERFDSRSTNPKRHDYSGKGQLDRVLWSEEPIDASRMVCCRRTVSITLRSTAYCEEEASLGAVGTRRIINRLSCQRIVRFLHARHRHRYHWLTHHARESSRTLRAEAYGWTGTDGWYLFAQQKLRFRRRNGTYREHHGSFMLIKPGQIS